MPGYSVPIKARMLYSSCKGPLIETLEANYSLKIDQKVRKVVVSWLIHHAFYNNCFPSLPSLIL